jgi:hypothetical protein
MTKCSHISRVKEWGFNEHHDFIASLWDCVLCGTISKEPFKSDEIIINHSECGEDCFGCKAKGLQLNTGDASSQKAMPNKKWDGELNEYKNARKQGIQPAGTSMAAVQEAYRASEVLGKAYDADTMVNTKVINKKSVESLKEAGSI